MNRLRKRTHNEMEIKTILHVVLLEPTLFLQCVPLKVANKHLRAFLLRFSAAKLTEFIVQSIRVKRLREALKRLKLVVRACVGIRNLVFILDVPSIHDGIFNSISRQRAVAFYRERDERN